MRCIQIQNLRITGHTCSAEALETLTAPTVPVRYMQIDNCMRPKMRKVLPVFIQELVKLRIQEGQQDPTYLLMFYVQVSLIHNQGNLSDYESWRRLVHAIVKTTSRRELLQASDDVDRWIWCLQNLGIIMSKERVTTIQSEQFIFEEFMGRLHITQRRASSTQCLEKQRHSCSING